MNYTNYTSYTNWKQLVCNNSYKLLLISNNLGNNEAIFHSYSLYSLYNSLFPVMKVIMYYIACIVCKACTVRKKGYYYTKIQLRYILRYLEICITEKYDKRSKEVIQFSVVIYI